MNKSDVMKYLKKRLAELEKIKSPNYQEDTVAAYELVLYDLFISGMVDK